jgi:TPR repeat protein
VHAGGAASRHDVEAVVLLGFAYLSGEGVSKDDAEAAKWFS